MILLGMAFLEAKYKFEPGLLYIGAFIIDLNIITGLFT
jgi:hypothetical protein